MAVPVLILWANIHGSALMGAGIAAGWAIYRMVVMRRRGDSRSSDRYIATAFAFGASALLVSTYSPHALVDYYRSVLQNPSLARYVPEWAPATFTGVSLVFVLLLALVLVVVGCGYRPRQAPVDSAGGADRGDGAGREFTPSATRCGSRSPRRCWWQT